MHAPRPLVLFGHTPLPDFERKDPNVCMRRSTGFQHDIKPMKAATGLQQVQGLEPQPELRRIVPQLLSKFSRVSGRFSALSLGWKLFPALRLPSWNYSGF